MPDPSRAEDRGYRVAVLVAVVVLLVPLLLTHYAPLVDYPNHLARAYILRHYDEVPAFAAEYARTLAPIPNVAIDVLVVGLQYLFPPLLAGKVFLVGVVLVWCLGCHLLGRAIHGGRPTWLAVPCMLLAYHGSFQYGFVNYALGLGVYFVGAAVWLARRGRWTWRGLALASLVAVAAYLTHLSSYALLGVTAVAVTVYDLLRRRMTLGSAVVGGLPFVPPLVLFAAFMRGGGSVGRVLWNTPAGKAIAVFSVIRSYDLRFDAVVAATLVLLAITAVVAARRTGRVEAYGAPLCASLVLGALFLICPKDLFTSGGADVRVVPAALVLFVLSWRLAMPARVGVLVLAAATAVLGVRTAAIGITWRALDQRIARAVAVLDALPSGARVLPLYTEGAVGDAAKRDRVLEHAPYYAVIYRRAYVPLLFAVRAQQPLVARHFAWGTISRDQLFASHLTEFDFVWTFGRHPSTAGALRLCCSPVAADADVELWQVRGGLR